MSLREQMVACGEPFEAILRVATCSDLKTFADLGWPPVDLKGAVRGAVDGHVDGVLFKTPTRMLAVHELGNELRYYAGGCYSDERRAVLEQDRMEAVGQELGTFPSANEAARFGECFLVSEMPLQAIKTPRLIRHRTDKCSSSNGFRPDMPNLPESSNFHGVLETKLSREQIANLFAARGWTVRKCSFTDIEIACPWAELVIEADAPILLHGAVADVLTHAEALLSPLREARISFRAECYGPDGKLLREVTESGHQSNPGTSHANQTRTRRNAGRSFLYLWNHSACQGSGSATRGSSRNTVLAGHGQDQFHPLGLGA